MYTSAGGYSAIVHLQLAHFSCDSFPWTAGKFVMARITGNLVNINIDVK